MKHLLSVIFFSISFASFSQSKYTPEQRLRDSLRLDSLGSYWDLRGPNRVLANLNPRPIPPVSDICFDKKITYYANARGRQINGCFYINTKDGYIAMFYNNYEESCKGMNSFESGYDMVIISKLGSSIHYRIDKRGKKTYFTEPPMTDMDRTTPTEYIYKNATYTGFYREPFTDQHLPTVAYVINGSSNSSTRYLFGPSFPRTIKLKNYLGAFGVGYFEDFNSSSTYICLALESPDLYVRVDKIEDVAECFDGSDFKKDERQSIIDEERERITEKEKKLDQQKESVSKSGNTCVARQQKIELKKEILKKEKAANEYMATNKNISDPRNIEGQRIIAAASDTKDRIILLRLETEEKICDVDYSLWIYAKNYPTRSTAKLTSRLQCLETSVEKLKAVEDEMTAIDNRNRNNPAKATREKNLLYFKSTKGLNCSY